MSEQGTHRLDSEATILGAAFMRPSVIGDVMGKIDADDFLHPAHRAIWLAMLELWLKEEPLDAALIASRSAKHGGAEAVATMGGADYITGLPNLCIVFESLGYHIRKVRASGQRYRWGQAFARLAQRSVGSGEADGDYLDSISAELVKMMLAHTETAKEKTRKEVLKETIKAIEFAYQNKHKKFIGVPTGFDCLDESSRGLRPGQLVVLAARPGVGKTAMMAQMVESAAQHGVSVLVFSLEMTAEELGKRLIATESGVDAQRITTGKLDPIHWVSITRAASNLSERNVTVVDVSSCTVNDIRSIAKRWRIANPDTLALVAVDYLQIVKPASSTTPRQEQVAEISRALKGLAKEIDAPVLALAQLNRKLEDRANKRPGMGDLRESGQIEQDADIILFIHREEVFSGAQGDQGKAELICAKGRSMPTFKADIGWQPQFTRFTNLASGHRS